MVRLRMADDIVKRSLYHAKEGCFGGGTEGWQLRGELQIDHKLALQLAHMASDGADQPQLIQQRWTQPIDQPADVGQCYFDVAFQID